MYERIIKKSDNNNKSLGDAVNEAYSHLDLTSKSIL